MISNIVIDYKDIQKELDCKIENRKYRKKIKVKLKDRVKILSLEYYIKHRNIIKKIFPESRMDTVMLDSHEKSNLFKCGIKNGVIADKNSLGEDIQPHFKVEYIQMAEIMPKENIPDFGNKVKKFKQKYSNQSSFLFQGHSIDYDFCKEVNENGFDMLIATFAIKENGRFGECFSSCEIRMQSISKSFVLISFQLTLRDSWAEKIENLILKDVGIYKYYGDVSNIKFKDLRIIQKGYVSETAYKQYLFDAICEETKYVARKEIVKSFEFVVKKYKQSNIYAFWFINTNIDKNSNKIFWKSIGVEPQRCFCSSTEDACITFGNYEGNNIYCLYKENKKSKYYGIFNHDVGYDFNTISALNNTEIATEHVLTLINTWIYKSRYDGIEVWLELKRITENKLEYFRRFFSEFDSNMIFEWTFRNMSNEDLHGERFYVNTKDKIENVRNSLENISLIVNEKFSTKSTSASISIQQITFITNFMSAIFALIAIIISLISEEGNAYIVYMMANSKFILCIIGVALALVIAWMLRKILDKTISFVKKTIRFWVDS